LLIAGAVRNLPLTVEALGVHLEIPHLSNLVRRFLHEQLAQVAPNIELDDVPLADCPVLKNTTKIRVFPSAVAIYYAPSDFSGTRGMFRERIRAVDSWRHGPGRHDCVFVQHDPDQAGFLGLYVARVRHFFSIRHDKVDFPCALVSWYSTIGTMPCPGGGSSPILIIRVILQCPSFILTAKSVVHISWVLQALVEYRTT